MFVGVVLHNICERSISSFICWNITSLSNTIRTRSAYVVETAFKANNSRWVMTIHKFKGCSSQGSTKKVNHTAALPKKILVPRPRVNKSKAVKVCFKTAIHNFYLAISLSGEMRFEYFSLVPNNLKHFYQKWFRKMWSWSDTIDDGN